MNRFERYLPIIFSVLLLCGCGGGGSDSGSVSSGANQSGSFRVGGSVSGLNNSLVVSLRTTTFNNNITLTSDGNFSFTSLLVDGQNYRVSVISEPANQRCDVSNASGTINGADVNSVALACIDLATLSGTISPVAAIGYDSDVNDADAPYANNNSRENAQVLPNNVLTLHGFASAEGVGKYGVSGRFANTADEDDFFSVALQEGQQVQLQIVDYTGFGVDAPFFGDLDLYLYRLNSTSNQYELESYSLSDTEFEEITTATSGDYLIRVHAFSNADTPDPGGSKYVLRLAPAPANSNGATPTLVDFVPGEMMVQFNERRTNTSALSNARSLTATPFTYNHNDLDRPVLATFSKQARPLVGKSLTSNTVDEEEEKFNTLQVIKWMSLQEDVEFAEPNYIVQASAVPNDEFYRYQWHYPMLNLPQAWDIATGFSGAPVIVAVIDTGVYLNHPDLQNQLIPGYDFISNTNRARDGNGIDSNADDPGDDPARGKSSWHGTHVAGTVAARSDDGYGVTGVAWGAQIMPVRVLGYGGGATSDVLEGIRFAAGLSNVSGTVPPRRADVINLSLGGGFYSQSAQNTITAARNAGVIIVAAAGNENSSFPSYPASYDGVVSVSAITYSKLKASYSNYGSNIDVAAPGGQSSQDRNGDSYGDGVLSSIANDTNGTRTPAWSFYQGTSMAAPHVAGVVALMKSVYPALTPIEFDNLLASGSITEDLGSAGRDNVFGFGLIDANLAVRQAQLLAGGSTPPSPPPQLMATPASIVLGVTSQATLTLGSVGGQPNLTVVDVSADATWLSVNAISIDTNGLGQYRVVADSSNLDDGIYQTTINITYNNGDNLETAVVAVTLQAGMVSIEGRLNKQYVLLVEAESFDVVKAVPAIATDSGDLSFTFSRVEAGDYFIYSGTDVDNDRRLCQSGESCGAFPSLAERQAISVESEDISELNILVDILGGIKTSTGSNAGTEKMNSQSHKTLARPN